MNEKSSKRKFIVIVKRIFISILVFLVALIGLVLLLQKWTVAEISYTMTTDDMPNQHVERKFNGAKGYLIADLNVIELEFTQEMNPVIKLAVFFLEFYGIPDISIFLKCNDSRCQSISKCYVRAHYVLASASFASNECGSNIKIDQNEIAGEILYKQRIEKHGAVMEDIRLSFEKAEFKTIKFADYPSKEYFTSTVKPHLE